MRTELPFSTTLPAAGSWPVTVSTGLLDGTGYAFGLSPALTSALIAASRFWPITLGTATVGGPFETTSWTVWFFCTFVPASGLWLMTVPLGTSVLDWWETLGTRPASLIFLTARSSWMPA